MSSMLAGCEKPTAPEAREIAREATKKFEHGDLSGVNGIFTRMGSAGHFRWTNLVRNNALMITQNGASGMIDGYVVEEVVVAPGNRGRPLVERTLVGWPENAAFAVYATSNVHPGSFDRLAERQKLMPYTAMAVHRPDALQSWIATSGIVHIADPIIDRGCDMVKDSPPPIDYPLPDVKCEFALYEVMARAELVERGDLLDAVRRSMAERHSMLILPQRLPGVRFTTTCPATLGYDPEPHQSSCGNRLAFWLDNSLYDPSLGVDVRRMRYVYNSLWAKRAESWPNGKPNHDATWWRWTIHTPDGRLVKQDSAGPADNTTRQIDQWLMA
ncbi:MAG: hypothetical protein ACREOK_09370, partial [Gemmatimonadaceae bacterium]